MKTIKKISLVLTALALAFALIGLVGCKKGATEEENRLTQYAGTWEAREISFGEDPIDLDGVRFMFEFNDDGTGTLYSDDGEHDITWEVRGFTDPTLWVSIKESFEINGMKPDISSIQLKEGLTENSLTFNETWKTTVETDGYVIDAIFQMQCALVRVP